MDFLKEWFKNSVFNNEAFSNYVLFPAGFISAIILLIIQRILTRNKPSIIRVEKSFESSLIDLDQSIKSKLRGSGTKVSDK